MNRSNGLTGSVREIRTRTLLGLLAVVLVLTPWPAYNLVGGLEWRFVPRASALVGWRYMNIDIEKGSGAQTFNADIEMNGPFLGLSLYF